ncbi:MAG: NAD-dependent epimerase/dehydratase family protein [Bryobacteraceae bacterium]
MPDETESGKKVPSKCHAPHVLVSGSAGFVGSRLCDLLVRRGHRVLCVDNLFSFLCAKRGTPPAT